MKGNGGRAETVRTVSSLYKSFSSCSEHHAQELLDQLHISTALDEAIVLRARSKKVVLVTGNPGDGKTHLIRKVQKELPRTVTVRQDANELDNRTLIEEIDAAISEQRGLVLAINEGILLEICEEAKRRYPWAASLLNAVLRPYNYGTGPEADLGQVVILDLNLRNNLAPQIVSQAIERVVALSEAAGELDSTAAFNLARLKDPGVSARICHLLDAVGATGFHATMRDLLGFVAFLIFGDETVDALSSAQPYFLNSFEGGQGPLFDQIRKFDPLRTASPFLDDKLYMIEDDPEDWAATYPGEMREREDILSFQSVKRRAFFEHKQGLALLRPAQTDVEKVFKQLRQRSHSPEQTAVRLLNRFFDSRESLSDRLVLWKAHQFDARPTRFVATRQFVAADTLVVRLPELPSSLREVFLDHYPDHVVLCHKDMPVGEGLFIDRRLLEMLLAGDKYFGFGTRSLEAQLKVMSFYDRLASYSPSRQSIIEILRLENGSKVKIGVDLEDKKYYFPGGPL